MDFNLNLCQGCMRIKNLFICLGFTDDCPCQICLVKPMCKVVCETRKNYSNHTNLDIKELRAARIINHRKEKKNE